MSAAGRSPLFVEATTGSGLRLLEHAEQSGLSPILVTTDKTKYLQAAPTIVSRLIHDGRLVETPTLDGELSFADGGFPWVDKVGGVLCAADRFLVASASIASRAGVPYFPVESARTIRDKREMRLMIDRLGLRAVKWSDTATEAQLCDFVRSTAGPFIIKNVHGSGSQQTVLAETGADAARAFRGLISGERYLGGDLMIEQFLEVPVVSYESLVVRGEVKFIGLTDRAFGERPHFAEIGWGFPARVSPRQLEGMHNDVKSLVSELQLDQTPLHIEFLMAEDPVLMDVNVRIPGALISPMLQTLTGGQYYDALLAAALGQTPDDLITAGSAAIVKVYPQADGRLTSLDGIEAARDAEGVVELLVSANPGDRVRSARDYRGGIFQVITRADRLNEAKQRAASAAALVTYQVNSKD